MTGLRQASSADEPPQPGCYLLHAERLGDVVVAADANAGDPILDGIPCGEEKDADGGILCSEPAQDLEAVQIGQPDVEHHCVRTELGRDSDRTGPVQARPGLPTFQRQQSSQHLGQMRLVVDDEHSQLVRGRLGRGIEGGHSGESRRVCSALPLNVLCPAPASERTPQPARWIVSQTRRH
jgi:hypothetical protein